MAGERLRVAWLGPNPTDHAGVPYVATQILEGLTASGVSVDCYTTAAVSQLPSRLRNRARLTVISNVSAFDATRWYGRGPMSALLAFQVLRARAQVRLVARLAGRHRSHPYDVVYQFSQPELLALRGWRARLPPIVLHPQVHAKGEFRWHARERNLALSGESRARYAAVRAMLGSRSVIQRHDLPSADGVIAPSQAFAEQLRLDCGVRPERLRVIRNPVDLDRYTPPRQFQSRLTETPTVLYVGRFATRKGLELVVALSHRMARWAEPARLVVLGYPDQWSDYSRLLDRAHPNVLAAGRPTSRYEVEDAYRRALVFIAPSHYEPFGLTVAEALASGLPVVASDSVGAAEGVAADCCARFRRGDLDDLERGARLMVERMTGDGGPRISHRARNEAERLFSPSGFARDLRDALIGFASS